MIASAHGQDTIISMASSAPAATVGLSLAGLAIAGLVCVLSHHPGTVPFTRAG